VNDADAAATISSAAASRASLKRLLLLPREEKRETEAGDGQIVARGIVRAEHLDPHRQAERRGLGAAKSVPAPRWFLFLVLNLERFGSQRILLLKKGCSLNAHRFQARAGWSRLEHKILHLKVYGFSAPINKRGRGRRQRRPKKCPVQVLAGGIIHCLTQHAPFRLAGRSHVRRGNITQRAKEAHSNKHAHVSSPPRAAHGAARFPRTGNLHVKNKSQTAELWDFSWAIRPRGLFF
jgi:hypothetical protein